MGCRWSCCRIAIRHLTACEAHIFSVSPSFDTTTARECPKNKDGQEQRRRGLTRLVWSWLFLHRLLLGVWVYGSKLPNKRNLCICRLPCPPKNWEELFCWKIDLRKWIVAHFLFPTWTSKNFSGWLNLGWVPDTYVRQFRVIILFWVHCP